MEQIQSSTHAPGVVLSKYISNSGICARRKAEELIKNGAVSVNGSVITQWAYRVQTNDVITCHGKALNPQKEHIYIALNKPTETITSAADDEGRKTVLDLVKLRTRARLFPVGRLDCMTTGILLLTNDGELAQALAHPKFGVEKRYHITLSIPLRDYHKRMLITGSGLPEGMVKPDRIITFERKPRECIVCIHSGQNRVVRKLFHSLGYAVHKLNRISYAGISTRGLPKGAWRKLTDEEVQRLKRQTKFSLKNK
jgi:23S rRNA pseudouridine2605 synthase